MKLVLPAIIVLIIATGAFFYLKSDHSYKKFVPTYLSSPSPASANTFKSSNVMKFSLSIPVGYSSEEKAGSVTISSSKGEILILQNGTNFTNIDEYISNSQNSLKNRLVERKDIIINGLSGTYGFLDEEKIYLILSKDNYAVYMISTKNKELYSDLDQIAQSFRYTP